MRNGSVRNIRGEALECLFRPGDRYLWILRLICGVAAENAGLGTVQAPSRFGEAEMAHGHPSSRVPLGLHRRADPSTQDQVVGCMNQLSRTYPAVRASAFIRQSSGYLCRALDTHRLLSWPRQPGHVLSGRDLGVCDLGPPMRRPAWPSSGNKLPVRQRLLTLPGPSRRPLPRIGRIFRQREV